MVTKHTGNQLLHFIHLFVFIFLFSYSTSAQTTYYYDGSGNLNTTTNWWTNTNGTGSNPSNFTTTNRIYEIRNATSISISYNWAVSGTGSKIILGNSSIAAITLTHVSGNWDGTIDIAAASSGSNTIVFQQSDTNTPTLGTLNSTSVVNYNRAGTQTVQAVTYGNLIVSNSGTKTAAGSFTVASDFSFTGGEFILNNGTSYILTVNGNYSQSGTGFFNLNSGSSGTSIFNLAGNLTHTGTDLFSTYGNVTNGTVRFTGTGNIQTVSFNDPLKVEFVNYTVMSGASVQLNSNFAISRSTDSRWRATLAVNSGGTLNVQNFTIIEEDNDAGSPSGICFFTLNSGATLITSNTTGGSGIVPGTQTTKTFSSGANYEFRGTATGTYTFTPTVNTVNNLTVNNASSVAMSQHFVVNGALTFTSGKLNLNNNTLTLNGTSGSGVITGSATSVLNITGTGALGSNITLDQTSSSTKSLGTFRVARTSSTITLGDTIQVIDTLKLNDGTLATSDKLVLVSSASKTARVATVTGTGAVTGNTIVQRYVPGGAGKRRYRTMSSPVNVSGSITYAQLIDDTYISNPGAPANGFDQTPQQNASAFTYNEAVSGDMNTGWVIPTSTSSTITTGKGFMIMVRGSRSTTDPFNPLSTPNNTLFDFVGAINTGNISPNLTYTNTGSVINDGWNLIGNPYPSQIDWNASSGWTKSNISSTIYIYNPNTGTYGTWNGSIGTNGATRYIASGQAFFVKATAASPALTFTESVKSTNTPSNLFRTSSLLVSSAPNTISIILHRDSVTSDETVLQFMDSASVNYDPNEDALKFPNATVNVFTQSKDGVDLSINVYRTPQTSDTIPLAVTGSNATYQLMFNDIEQLDADLEMILIDQFTQDTLIVSEDTTININITPDPLSKGYRFKLIFNRIVIPPPAVSIIFTGKAKKHKVDLTWITADTLNNVYFIVERSTDGQTYALVDTIIKAKKKKQPTIYKLTDKHPFQGINYYRLTVVDSSGATIFTDTIAIMVPPGARIKTTQTEIEFMVYPNPAKDMVYFSSSEEINEITIYNIQGKKVVQEMVTPSSMISQDISNLEPGIYFVKIRNTVTGSEQSVKIIKQ